MGTADDKMGVTVWERIALARLWLLVRSREQLHYAIDVLFQAVVYSVTVALIVFVLNVLQMDLAVDFDLIGAFVGPLCLGALAAGVVRGLIPDGAAAKGWAVSGSYGGVAVMAFAILVELKWRAPTLTGAAVGFLLGAIVFMLLHWLYELEARKRRES